MYPSPFYVRFIENLGTFIEEIKLISILCLALFQIITYMKKHSIIPVLVILAVIIFSCNPEEKIEPVVTNQEGFLSITPPPGFAFTTTETVTLRLTGQLSDGVPLANVVYEVFDGNPYKNGKKISSILLDDQGKGVLDISIPNDLTEVYLYTSYLGIPPVKKVEIGRPSTQILINASSDSFDFGDDQRSTSNPNARVTRLPADFTVMGTYNSNGLPSYIIGKDPIKPDFLLRLNNNLPERKDVRQTNPSLLDEKFPRQLSVKEDAEVWVTFVHNGAGWRNVLGYYYYKDGEAPKTPADIKNKIVIFPHINALSVGEKVKLKGNLPNGAFEKGTQIGWFVIANGWNGSLTLGNAVLFSDKNLNTFTSNASLREQLIFLYDQQERIMVMGWEDMPRNGSDHDFNDVVFYASWNPLTSVETGAYLVLDSKTPKDIDGDGVLDIFDEFPTDSERSFTNHFPSKGAFGTLLFEDMWPAYGDYDMNDLVLGFNNKEITDGKGRVKQMDMTFVIRATGAGTRNGFGLEFPIQPDAIESISGTRMSTGKIKTNPNGTESGQKTAVAIVFDDANQKMPIMANVFQNNSFTLQDTIRMKVIFKVPVDRKELGEQPYNAFIFKTDNRGNEIHFIGGKPTTLATPSLFGTKDDRSSLTKNVYYVSESGLNWGMFIPQSIDHAQEKNDFSGGYLEFKEWAKTGGSFKKDWYKDKGNNIDKSSIYIRKQ